METYIIIGVSVFVIIIWVKSLHIGKDFVIRISAGKVIVKKGNPPPSFVEECKLVIRHSIGKGYIYGLKENNTIKLTFSKSIKPDQAQRFRNIFPYQKIINSDIGLIRK